MHAHLKIKLKNCDRESDIHVYKITPLYVQYPTQYT